MATHPLREASASRQAPYIEELREFFATSGVPFGSPDNIFALADRVREAGNFSDDLSSLVRSIVLRHGGAMPLAELLDILSLAVAGPEPAHAPEQFREPLRQLLEFISGVMRRPWNVPPNESAEIVPFPSEARASEPPPRLPFAIFEQIRSVQMREEKARESRSELSSRILALPVPEFPNPVFESVPQPAEAATGSDGSPRRRQTPKHRNLLLGAAGVMALAAVLILALRPHQPKEVFHVEPAPTYTTAASSAAIATPLPAGAVAASNEPVAAAGQPQLNRRPNPAVSTTPQSAVLPPSAGNSRPATSASPSTVLAASSPAPAISKSPAAPITRRPSHRDSDSTIVGDVPARPTGSTAPARTPHFVVSSGVMAAYLISSPNPDYPTLAHITHVEGQVVMQAVVAKDGSVSFVHVLRGNRLLRRAAQDAVRRWRYRPFRLGGQPVDVATIVTVDFHDRN